MDSRRGGRFPRYPPLHGLPLGLMGRHTTGSDYSNFVTDYEREPHVPFREYGSRHRPSDTGTHLDPHITHTGNLPSQRFNRYYHECRGNHNFQNPFLRPHAVNTGPAPAPGMCSLAGNRSGQFLDQGIRNPRQIPPVPVRGKEMEVGMPRHLNRVIPGSSEMVHSKFYGNPLSQQKPSLSLLRDQKQKIDHLFKQSIKASTCDSLHDKPSVRKNATMQSVGNTDAEQSNHNLHKGPPSTMNQSTRKGNFVPVSAFGNHGSNLESMVSLQIVQKSLDKVKLPKAPVSKVSSSITEVRSTMNEEIILGKTGGEEVCQNLPIKSSSEELDEVELTSKFKDIDICTSNRETDEENTFPKNDLPDLRKNKDLIECVSQIDGSHSSERKVVDITSAVTKDIDVTNATTKDVDVTSTVAKDIDVTNAVAKDVDVTSVVTKDVDVTSVESKGVDVTSEMPKGVDVTSEMPKGVDVTSAMTKGVYVTCAVTKVLDVISAMVKGVDVTSTVTRGLDVLSAVTKGVDVISTVTEGVDVKNALNNGCDNSNAFNVKDANNFVEMEVDNDSIFSRETFDENSSSDRTELSENEFVEVAKCPSLVSITSGSVSKPSEQDEGSNINEGSSSNDVVKSESNLPRNTEDTFIKSKVNDVVNRENNNGRKNHLQVEKQSKQVALNSVTALQRRVMAKVNKPSFVKQVSDYSLALLTKKKVEVSDQSVADESLERTGSHGSMSDDFTVEDDSSLDIFSALPRKSDSNLTNNLSVSEENKKLEDSVNEELNYTEEISNCENNVCNNLWGISKEKVDSENGNVDMHASNCSHEIEAVGTDLCSIDFNNGIGEDIDEDGSIKLYVSVDTYISGLLDKTDIEEKDPSQSCGTIANEAVETNQGLQETDFAQLKKNLNIKEAFVSLTKIDVERREEHQMIYKTDKQNKPVDEIPLEGTETEGNFDKLESHVVEQDQAELVSDVLKSEKAELNSDKLGSSVLKPDQAEVNTDKLGSRFVDSDQTKDETDKLESSINKLDQTEESKKHLTNSINYRRQLISLNERFSQLPNKSIDGGTEEDSKEKAYKAEFENILNKLSKKSLLGSQSEIEKGKIMEVEHERDDDMKETKLDGDNKQTELHVETGGARFLQDCSSNEAREMKETPENAKDKKVEESSPVSFLAFSDEESDDELLRTPSAFLRSIEEINARPVVITPTKVMDSSQNSTGTTSSSDLSPIKPIAQRPGVKNKFTLDGLLADHEEKADLVREMDEINQQLQHEIKQGGFVNILNKEDAATESQITEEQKEMLKHFEVQESHICEDRPGVVVFQPQHYKSLFSSMLHPTHCGFTVGSNGLLLEKHIESLRTGQYKRVITSDIIYQCFTKISCQTPLLRWLFFIMSIHDDHQVQQGCKKILLEVLHFQHVYGHQKWTPRLVDVLSVLVNYGASLETLLPADCGSDTLELVRVKLMQEPGYVHGPGQQNAEVSVENLILVLKILTQCLYGPSGRYKPDDLSLLCVALCKASLDSSLKNMCAKGAFQNCITMLIRHYPEADWLKERLKLTRMLVGITSHHHNCAHIAELLPPGQRGLFLQRRFCYLVLSEILLDKTNVSDEVLSSIQIQDLQVFVPKLEELLENDTYRMSSVVTLIDLCVGVHITMSSEQREQLKSLLEQVRRVRVRDNVSMLDRTRVKDMIVRMTSKWALDIQTMKGKQTKIFEYASPMKICIEQVKTLQSSGDEEENSDTDDDPPCKIQKLSQAADY